MIHTKSNGNDYQIHHTKHGKYQIYQTVSGKTGEQHSRHVGYSSSERGAKLLIAHYDPEKFPCPSFCTSWDAKPCDCSKVSK